MVIDDGEGGDGGGVWEAVGFHPAEPVAEVVFIDPGDGAEAAGGVAVHGGVSDGCFGAVAGGEEEGVADVGDHPDAGGADAGLDVLAGDVVGGPGEIALDDCFNFAFVGFDEVIDFPFGEFAAEGLREGAGGVAGDLAAVSGALVGAEEEGFDPGGRVFGEGDVGEFFTEAFFAEVGEGEIEHDFDEGGDGCGVGTAAEGDDEALGPAFAEVVEVGEAHGAGVFFFFRHGGDGVVAVEVRDGGPGVGDDDFGEAFEIDEAADGAGLVEAITLDIDGFDAEGEVLEGEAGAFGDDAAGVGDESAAVVDGASGFVSEEVGVDVGGSEGAGSFDDELFTDFLFSEGEVAGAGV